MAAETATFNGVPAWLLTDYLVGLGGEANGDTVTGPGWTATLNAPPRPPGSLGLGRVTVTIEGPAAAETLAALRVKARRGGG